jgi:arylsulfatase
MKAGRVHHEYNYFALERTNVSCPEALGAGKHVIVYEFVPDGPGAGTGGRSILSVDGRKVAEAHIPKTQPYAFSADEGADVGRDGETNVSLDYPQGANAFTGKITRVTIETK